jgi:hypothetical protein
MVTYCSAAARQSPRSSATSATIIRDAASLAAVTIGLSAVDLSAAEATPSEARQASSAGSKRAVSPGS